MKPSNNEPEYIVLARHLISKGKQIEGTQYEDGIYVIQKLGHQTIKLKIEEKSPAYYSIMTAMKTAEGLPLNIEYDMSDRLGGNGLYFVHKDQNMIREVNVTRNSPLHKAVQLILDTNERYLESELEKVKVEICKTTNALEEMYAKKEEEEVKVKKLLGLD